MGCCSYLTGHELISASGERTLVQFKYGFLREISYSVGDEIYWEKAEISPEWVCAERIDVPGWDQWGEDGYFAIEVDQNEIRGLRRITETDLNELEKQFDSDGRHCWRRKN